MPKYADVRAMSKLATEDYSKFGSIEQIRPPYPARGTPNWWALRLRYRELLDAELRKDRAASQVRGEIRNDIAEAAEWASLGNETADRDYQKLR